MNLNMPARRSFPMTFLPSGRIVFATPFFLAALFCAGCDGSASQPPVAKSPDAEVKAPAPFVFSPAAPKPNRATAPVATIHFSEVSRELGFQHVYENGEQGESIMVETLGGGGGWLDFDRDGRWDLLLNQGGDPTKPADASQPRDALYRNIGKAGFQEVSAAARFNEYGYGQGVAVGDYDNDGFDDLYITNVGANTLWRNLGDGTFEEVGKVARVADPRWSSSAAWGDLDLDGDLDLYVCNYLVYDPHNPMECVTKKGEHRICHPRDLDPWPDACFMNQGDGVFTQEDRQRGLFGEGNKGLGVVIADFNNDRLPDLYVANDTTANFLFQNRGDAQFEETAYLSGCAVNRHGSYQASMGLGVADVDNNGFLDIYVSHFYHESNTLYQNLGAQGFQDNTAIAGLHALTMPYLGFGVVISDFNQNGFQDIFVTNGHIENYPGNPLRKMRPQVLAFNGSVWQDIRPFAGDFFGEKHAGRGVAWCDFDNDGDADLAVIHQQEPAAILRNDSQRGHWLKFQFRGRSSNRRGIGARVIVRIGEKQWMQELVGGGSYASSRQPALIFGFGDLSGPCDIEVLWPSGKTQHLADIALDQELILDEPRSE